MKLWESLALKIQEILATLRNSLPHTPTLQPGMCFAPGGSSQQAVIGLPVIPFGWLRYQNLLTREFWGCSVHVSSVISAPCSAPRDSQVLILFIHKPSTILAFPRPHSILPPCSPPWSSQHFLFLFLLFFSLSKCPAITFTENNWFCYISATLSFAIVVWRVNSLQI